MDCSANPLIESSDITPTHPTTNIIFYAFSAISAVFTTILSDILYIFKPRYSLSSQQSIKKFARINSESSISNADDEYNIHYYIKLCYPNYKQQDTQQTINIIINFSMESFKIVMATILSIFVPQSCNGEICSMEENMTNMTYYNIFVVAFNFFTMFYFIILYVHEIRREMWMITHLEYDSKYNENHIHEYFEKYPKISKQLRMHNKVYYVTYKYLRYLYFLNILFSGVLVFYFYYLDYRTITTFVTNIILCWTKVFKGYFLANRSMQENIALSYYNTHFLSFNAIDVNYVLPSSSLGEEPPFGIDGGSGDGGGRGASASDGSDIHRDNSNNL